MRRLATTAAALLLVAGAAGCSDDADAQASLDAGVSAEEAAEKMLVEMTSYSHQSLEEDFAWQEEYLASDFAEEYADNIESIKEFVEGGELVVTGTVLDRAHRMVDVNEVVVLAFVDQDITSERTGQTVAEEMRVRLVLTREDEDDDWIVENLEVLSGQTALP